MEDYQKQIASNDSKIESYQAVIKGMIDKARIEGINVPLKADDDDELVEDTTQNKEKGKDKEKDMADVDDIVSVRSQGAENEMADVVKTELKDEGKGQIKREKGRSSLASEMDSHKKKEIEVD